MLEVNQFRVSALIVVAAVLAAVLLALVGSRPAEAAFPGENGKIAFYSNRTAGAGVNNPQAEYEIFAMNKDGTGIAQLTSNTENDYFPAWSADGNWMALASNQDGNPEIYMRTDGYFDSASGHAVFAQTLRLTTNTANDFEPTFSPDGTRIAFTSDRDGNNEVYVMDTADSNNDGNGDNLANLTNNTAPDLDPVWSPDGTKIAFQTSRDGNMEVYVMDSDGTDLVNLTNNEEAYDVDPNWSPDGTRIAFTSIRDGGNADIYAMNASDGSEMKRLTRKAADDYQPAFSPDGKKIAFTTNRDGGDPEIYAMQARPESKRNRPKNLTKNEELDTGPDWQPVP